MRLHACLCLYVCVCIRVYVCVHTSHLHGAMPHRFHWGVWEQRLSISSAAVPAGKSLIIISWMMSLRHAPHSRPVAASLQHPSLSLSRSSFHFLYFFLFFYFWKFSFYSLSFTCAARCLSSVFCSAPSVRLWLPLSHFAFIILSLHLTQRN